MATYLQLQSEQVWWDQFIPPNLTSLLIEPLVAFYNISDAAVGSAGDNNHLYGRHRSANWDLGSRYCTDRSYGTTNSKDKQGDLDWYRAVDVGIQGQRLWDASHRIDNAVRAGRAPAIAEWFGTFDGQTVVGWFEGHPSSSDNSHLSHLHVGFWNQYANDADVMRQTFGIITGQLPDRQEVDDVLMIAVARSGDKYTYWAGNGIESRQLADKNVADNLIGALKIYGVPDPKILNYNSDEEFVHQILGPPAVAVVTNLTTGG